MEDPDVVEVLASDCPTSIPKRRKRAKVVPHDVIEIEEDVPARDVVIDDKVTTGNKGKDKLTGYDNYRGNQVKFFQEALTQDFVLSGNATEIGLMNNNSLNPPVSTGVGSQYLNNLYGGPLNYGLSNFPYPYNTSPSYNGIASFQSPFNSMDFSIGLGASFPLFGQPGAIYSHPGTSSSWTPPGVLPFSWSQAKKDDAFWLPPPAQNFGKLSSTNNVTSNQPGYTRDMNVDDDEVLRRYKLFKGFDTVGDYSDHHYAHMSSNVRQPQRNWAKVIQQEWKILQNDLPDTIFVRVYEERMDLLRALIVGAAGTPYHDGLFFFDVFFPPNYPNVPPQVHYHSGGLRLNPNLYGCGKVCLSLLNTWHGSREEQWTPRKSTMLQVLLSIQALVLNAKPFFNEPGYAPMAGGAEGEKRSHAYNESTYILSCRTMLFTLKRPPKHFEEYVVGHFLDRAHAILVACKAYMEGAQVGCLVEGGVQDVDEGDKSCSQQFKTQVSSIVQTLVAAFVKNGSKNCQQFLPQTNNNRNSNGNSNTYTTSATTTPAMANNAYGSQSKGLMW